MEMEYSYHRVKIEPQTLFLVTNVLQGLARMNRIAHKDLHYLCRGKYITGHLQEKTL